MILKFALGIKINHILCNFLLFSLKTPVFLAFNAVFCAVQNSCFRYVSQDFVEEMFKVIQKELIYIHIVNFLREKNWSQLGTNLGYLGSLSPKCPFLKVQGLVILSPPNYYEWNLKAFLLEVLIIVQFLTSPLCTGSKVKAIFGNFRNCKSMTNF